MKKLLSVLLTLALLLSIGVIPYSVNAAETETKTNNGFTLDFNANDTKTFTSWDASTDADGNTFYPIKFNQYGTGSPTVTTELVSLEDGDGNTHDLLKITGTRNNTGNPSIIDIILTDKDGHPFVMDANSLYKVEYTMYVQTSNAAKVNFGTGVPAAIISKYIEGKESTADIVFGVRKNYAWTMQYNSNFGVATNTYLTGGLYGSETDIFTLKDGSKYLSVATTANENWYEKKVTGSLEFITEGEERTNNCYELKNETSNYALRIESYFAMHLASPVNATNPTAVYYLDNIKVTKDVKEYSTSTVNFNGGYEDFDLTKSFTSKTFDVSEQISLPETAYKLRCAFGGWYTDEALTEKAGKYYEKGKNYYAKWISYGDVNDDGSVNSLDLVRLAKKIAGQNVIASEGADITGDGSVTSADLVRFKKHLAGQSVILGPTRYIALTFDDGPNEYVNTIVDAFAKYKGECTFFCIGSKLTDSTKQYAQYAIDNGCEIGNHTSLHGNLSGKTNADDIKTAFNNMSDKVKTMLDYDVKVARLPELAGSDLVYQTTKEMGLPLFGSCASVGDWSGSVNAQTVCERIIAQAVDGGVMCLHAIEKTTSIIPEALEELHKDGYEFVTVSDLYTIKGYKSIPLGKQLTRANVQKKLIALTFDDGPNQYMMNVMEQMATVKGHCTFFLVGKNINSNMAPYLLAADKAGHQLASHSYSHTSFTKLTNEQILEEVNKTNDALYAITGKKTTCLRLPGLNENADVLAYCESIGVPLIGGYMGATNDWAGTTTTAEEVAASIMKKAVDGAIICCHSTEKTANALAIALPQLKEQGFEFVTVDELYEQREYDSIPLGVQNKLVTIE